MAKLYSEIRIRSVNGLGDAQEGKGSLFQEDDVVYSIADSAFKKRNSSAYDAGNPGNAWDTVGGGGGIASLVDDTSPQLGGTLDANGEDIDMGTNVITDAKVGQWDTAYGWGDHDGLYLDQAAVDIRANLRIGAANVSALNDVDYNSVVLDGSNGDGKVLAWSESLQKFAPVDQSGGGASNLSGLTDVLTNAPADGHILQYVGGNNRFENASFEDVARDKYEITANGSSDFRFAGPGMTGSENDPKLYLIRGKSYSFTNNAGASHPFQIQTSTGAIEAVVGNRYNSGITGLDGNRQLANGQAMVWEVMMDAPEVLYYHCGQHLAMAGEIRILDEGSASGGNSIIEGDTKVQVLDSGSDGQIEFFTENTHRWNITTAGHLIPNAHDTYDIGSADKKVRDLYVSDSSLWVGDEHKISITSDGEMKFLKRRKGRIPSGANAADTTIEDIRTQGGLAGSKTLENMTLEDWTKYSNGRGIPFNQLFSPDDNLDWEHEGAGVDSTYIVAHKSTSVTKSFDVAVDNKQATVWKGDGGQTGGNAFYIDGIPHPELRLKAGTYRFYQKHISNKTAGGLHHPISFYTAEDKSGDLDDTKIRYFREDNDLGTPGDQIQEFTGVSKRTDYINSIDNAATNDFSQYKYYVELTVDDTLPADFWYQCTAHGYMGMRIVNEAATGGGGANAINDLTDVNNGGVQNGDSLIWDSGGYIAKPALENQFAAVKQSVTNSDVQLHPTLRNNFGGRVVVDASGQTSGHVVLDLGQLYDAGFQKQRTMSFEIYEKTGQAMNVKAINQTASPLNLEANRKTYDNQSRGGGATDDHLRLEQNDEFQLGLDVDQVLIIYCDGTDWYHEFRAL